MPQVDLKKERDAERARTWRQKHPDAARAASERYRKKNLESERERHRRYASANAEKRRMYAKNKYVNGGAQNQLKWKAENKEHLRQYRAAYAKLNPEKFALKTARRRAAKRCAIPSWSETEAISALYAEASARGLHVDHIVPLRSKIVCGLHCIANLQLLPGLANALKSNQFWPDMP